MEITFLLKWLIHSQYGEEKVNQEPGVSYAKEQGSAQRDKNMQQDRDQLKEDATGQIWGKIMTMM